MITRISIVFILLAGTLAAPFLLRPEGEKGSISFQKAERLVIITPHNESIRAEFERAFVRHMREKHGRDVFVDWRQPGGTSEIAMFLKSEFTNAFGNHWRAETGKPFTNEVRSAFTEPKIDGAGPGADFNETERRAREMFLASEVSVGIDLFFGGGAYDFQKQASAGALVSTDASGRYGPAALAREEPDWFSEAVIPETVSGEPFRDPEFRWVGTVLSAFGICFNHDSLDRLGIESPPAQWIDLTKPAFFGEVALADPTKSGSATKAFEMLIQQQIRQALDGVQSQARAPQEIERDAVREGWDEAMRMILKISANARYFSESATKIPHDVAQGDAAAGMCIDFYGRTYNELHKREDGSSRIEFVMPKGGTSIGADPIALMRGAPHPELAHLFIRYVLSTEGQKIWDYEPGTPGGPLRKSLRRPPIRKDFYTAENRRYMADADVNPYEISKGFTYEADWTGSAFRALRFIIRSTCVDTHHEQRDAWRALIEAGMPADALAEFEDVSAISYDEALGPISDVLNARDKIREVELARELAGVFREKYRKTRHLAAKGREVPVSSE